MTAELLMIAVLSLAGIFIFGFWQFSLFLGAVIGISYFTTTPAYQRFVRRFRPNPRSAPSRIRKNGMTAAEFLKWAMDRHQAMESFRATVDISGTCTGTRYMSYERPNKYRITNEIPNGHSLTSVCDGTRVVEYSVPPSSEARSYPPPDSIPQAHSMFMMHPMFCGSLLNRFFAGGRCLDLLADVTKKPIEYGNEEYVGDELCREVAFYGVEMYGNTSALIGTRSGFVHRIAYDSEPLMFLMNSATYRTQMQKVFRANIAKEKDPDKRAELEKQLDEYDRRGDEGSWEHEWTRCTIREIQVDGHIPESTFDTTPPDGSEVVPHDSGPRLPVPIGEPAPDASVFDLQGKEIKLSDFIGKVLLIDVWATWCGPCRKGLPDTINLAKAGHSEQFEVLAVSNEAPALIEEFLQEENLLDLPACTDQDQDLSRKYNVTSIPTVIIIDAEGNLSDYLVGLRPAQELRSAIDKAKRS